MKNMREFNATLKDKSPHNRIGLYILKMHEDRGSKNLNMKLK
jgi:hypothetical protein